MELQQSGIGRTLAIALIGGVFVLLCLSVLATVFFIDRQGAHYPDAQLVSRHNNYSQLPSRFRWDDQYRTTDPINRVYEWYSITFNLGAEKAANGNCSYLEDEKLILWRLHRHIGILVCESGPYRSIFVNRTTYVR